MLGHLVHECVFVEGGVEIGVVVDEDGCHIFDILYFTVPVDVILMK